MNHAHSIQDLLDAHELIVKTRKQICNGPDFPWMVLCHAERYVNNLLKAMFVEVPA